MVENIVNCEQVWREISNYVDGDVPAPRRGEMDVHFKTCRRCASVLAGTRNVVRLYGDERILEIPAGFSSRLERRLTSNEAAGGERWSSWSAWLAPVAAIALIVGTVGMMNSLTFRNYIRSQHAEPGKNIPPDLVVVVSEGSKLFHVPGCRFIHDPASERAMTAKQAAQQGYVPCTRCLRQYLKTGLTDRHGPEVADGDGDENKETPEQVLSVSGD